MAEFEGFRQTDMRNFMKRVPRARRGASGFELGKIGAR
jgi:hypothetical protein